MEHQLAQPPHQSHTDTAWPAKAPGKGVTIAALRRVFKTGDDADRYRKYYGKAAFEVWLNHMLPKLVHEMCNLVDEQKRYFTLLEVKSLVKLYVRSKPWGYFFMAAEARPVATADMIATWVSGLDGWGHAARQALYRERVPVVEGIFTKEFWQTFVAKPKSSSVENPSNNRDNAESEVKAGVNYQVGKHDWCVGNQTEEGFLVFVDDRPVSYRPTLESARTLALEIIARCAADGDYRLNDKPAGFNPPALPVRGEV